MSQRKRAYKAEAETDYVDLVRLWIFRILDTPKGRSKFIYSGMFRDDDVAEYIGMGRTMQLSQDKNDTVKLRIEFQERSKKAEAAAGSKRIPPFIAKNFRKLASLAGLKKNELSVLQFIAFREAIPVINDALSVLGEVSTQTGSRIIARALKIPEKEVARATSYTGPLVQRGLIKYDDMHRGRTKLPSFFSSNAAEFLLQEDFNTNLLLSQIVQQTPTPTLSFADYPHLKATLDLLRPYLRQILKTRKEGVNILFHGPPGTGKSELSRILARELRCPLYEIASADSDGDSLYSKHRLDSLRLANTLVVQRSLLVFDEAEDVFNDGSSYIPSTVHSRKGWMNRMLEHNRIPTIWISNSVICMDPANVRRFDFVIEVPIPDKNQREKTFRKICGGIVSDEVVNRIAKVERVAPAVVARTAAVITTIRNNIPETSKDQAFERLIDNTLKAQGEREGLKTRDYPTLPVFYNPTFVNTDVNLVDIGKTLTETASCRMCLYGPPGTGKTSFAHWVAERAGKPLHIKRASDILGPYVGMTERNLAEAFKQAQMESAILLLDEVDTFLQDRQHAVRSWEVSEVNELLTQMETFKGIFIASTNLMDNLDQAALRRFDLKILFDFLKPEQAQQLLLTHCSQLGLEEPSIDLLGRIAALSTLTPGDFANVARQHRFRKFTKAEQLVDALAAECRLKKIPVRGRLGFG